MADTVECPKCHVEIPIGEEIDAARATVREEERLEAESKLNSAVVDARDEERREIDKEITEAVTEGKAETEEEIRAEYTGVGTRNAVPGPYHVVSRADDPDLHTVEVELLRGEQRDGSVTMSPHALAALDRILERYRADAHVSGAAHRVYTNTETVEAACEALNRCAS